MGNAITDDVPRFSEYEVLRKRDNIFATFQCHSCDEPYLIGHKLGASFAQYTRAKKKHVQDESRTGGHPHIGVDDRTFCYSRDQKYSGMAKKKTPGAQISDLDPDPLPSPPEGDVYFGNVLCSACL